MRQEMHLRVMEKDDLEFLHKLNNDPAVMDYWFEEPYMSLEKLKDSYEKNLDSERHRQFILTQNGEKLGFVGLFGMNQRDRNAEFAIMIDPIHQGNGYAKTATQLALEYAFDRLNLHKVYLIVDKENEKAVHIYEKAGFTVEGTMKEHFYVNGRYHDAVSMCVLKQDFQ
ncbi:Diamine N-acetyltransferase [Lentibacillus sp. JNUCC-1]|uniref:GNAT family N-acetyltransferase n=1 Tax=Lentibacillus sp. JNUCC-1 TaxID=2654513 RepID=UPI0012E814A7|nr:GNAT family N-acetyltransferase [Lentibacillus sp. JNUCC-1]MUV38989.1 Diamine N-acetyltransferase [Lentibacillus sp. JNUCC-1]